MSARSTSDGAGGASSAEAQALTPVEREMQRRQSIGRQLYDALVNDVAKAQAVFLHRKQRAPVSR